MCEPIERVKYRVPLGWERVAALRSWNAGWLVGWLVGWLAGVGGFTLGGVELTLAWLGADLCPTLFKSSASLKLTLKALNQPRAANK